MDAKLDSLHQLYHVTDKKITKSNPENVKAMRSFFESITGKNGNNDEFNIEKFIKTVNTR